VAHEHYGPAEDGGGEIFPDWELDKADRAGEAGYKIAKVEGAAALGVLLHVQMRVCLNSHDGYVAQSDLIEVLEHVGHEHQRHRAKELVGG
jgi:hypothetical protein